MPVIDVDTHYTEPYDLWSKRAPAKYKDLVPQVRQIDGVNHWFINDQLMSRTGAASVVGKDGVKIVGTDFFTLTPEDVDPACNQVKPRLKYMDEMGVDAQIIYGNLLGFGGQRAYNTPADLRLLSTQLYNDHMAELQEESGQRMFPMALMPWWDMKICLEELQRCHKMGLRGINTNSDPQDHKLPDLAEGHWDPLWEMAADLGMSINFHIGASDASSTWFGDSPWPSFSPDQKLAMGSAMMYLSNAKVIGNIIYSGILEKFPKLKFVSVESGIGWIPFVLEALDYQLGETSPKAWKHLTMKPSEYFKRNIYGCYWFEKEGLVPMIEKVGVDNVMFETDFPHPTCLFPKPLESAAIALKGTSKEFRAKVVGGNAVKLYNLPF